MVIGFIRSVMPVEGKMERGRLRLRTTRPCESAEWEENAPNERSRRRAAAPPGSAFYRFLCSLISSGSAAPSLASEPGVVSTLRNRPRIGESGLDPGFDLVVGGNVRVGDGEKALGKNQTAITNKQKINPRQRLKTDILGLRTAIGPYRFDGVFGDSLLFSAAVRSFGSPATITSAHSIYYEIHRVSL